MFSLEQRKLEGILCMCIYLVVENEDEGVGLLSRASDSVTRDSEHKLKQVKFPLNTNKHLSTMRIDKHWKRLPREIMESAFREIFKTKLDTTPGNLLWLTLNEQDGASR